LPSRWGCCWSAVESQSESRCKGSAGDRSVCPYAGEFARGAVDAVSGNGLRRCLIRHIEMPVHIRCPKERDATRGNCRSGKRRQSTIRPDAVFADGISGGSSCAAVDHLDVLARAVRHDSAWTVERCVGVRIEGRNRGEHSVSGCGFVGGLGDLNP